MFLVFIGEREKVLKKQFFESIVDLSTRYPFHDYTGDADPKVEVRATLNRQESHSYFVVPTGQILTLLTNRMFY